jgi:hypothetical protein
MGTGLLGDVLRCKVPFAPGLFWTCFCKKSKQEERPGILDFLTIIYSGPFGSTLWRCEEITAQGKSIAINHRLPSVQYLGWDGGWRLDKFLGSGF